MTRTRLWTWLAASCPAIWLLNWNRWLLPLLLLLLWYDLEVLVNTLGSEPAWQELWSKLHTTLNQIRYITRKNWSSIEWSSVFCRCLSEDLNSHHFHPAAAKVKGNTFLYFTVIIILYLYSSESVWGESVDKALCRSGCRGSSICVSSEKKVSCDQSVINFDSNAHCQARFMSQNYTGFSTLKVWWSFFIMIKCHLYYMLLQKCLCHFCW